MFTKTQQQCFVKGSERQQKNKLYLRQSVSVTPNLFICHTVTSISLIHLLICLSCIYQIIKLSHMAFWLWEWTLGLLGQLNFRKSPFLCLSASCLSVTEGLQHSMSCETCGGRDYAGGLEEVLLCQLVFRNSFLHSVFQAFSTLKNTFKPSKTFGS